MSYNVNLVPNIAPQGTVMQYTGATDPSGWVICDGQARSNTSGQYNSLINAGFLNQNSYSYLTTTSIDNITTYTIGSIWASGDGNTIIGDGQYISLNGGNGWIPIYQPFNIIPTSYRPTKVSLSNDGKTIVMNGYQSTTQGATWTTNACTSFSAVNSSGSTILMDSGTSTYLLLSTNSGSTYYQISSLSSGPYINNGLPTTTNTIYGVCMSSNATFMAAVIGASYSLYLSTNSGVNWSISSTISSLTCLTMSGNGNTIGYITSSRVYLSTNNGVTFTNVGSANSSLVISNNGLLACAGGFSNAFYSYSNSTWSANSSLTEFVYTPANVAANSTLSTIFLTWTSTPGSIGVSYNSYSSFNMITNNNNYPPGGTRGVPSNIHPSLTISNDGTKIFYASYGTNASSSYNMPLACGGVFLSTDSGNSFRNVLGYQTGAYGSSGMSGNGMVMMYAGMSTVTSAYLSTNGGQSFTRVVNNSIGGEKSISMSYDGKYILYGNIFSSNMGISFATIGTLPVSQNYSCSTAISYTGDRMLFTSNQNNSNGVVYLSTNYGINWNVISGSTNQYPSNGLLTGTSGIYCCVIAGSTNTMYISHWYIDAARPGRIWTSTDGYGQTWTAISGTTSAYTSNGLPTVDTPAWTCIVVSNDGTKLLATTTSANLIYYSSNSGVNWYNIYSATPHWGIPPTAAARLAISGSGNIMALNTGGSICLSNNGILWYFLGNTTNNTTYSSSVTFALGSNNWQTIAMNSTGSTVICGYNGSYLKVSYDYGKSYAEMMYNGNLNGVKNWLGTAVSSSGQYMLAVAYGENVYYSNNYGKIWYQVSGLASNPYFLTSGLPTTISNWYTCAMDGTGAFILAGINSGSLYLSTSSATYWTTISGVANTYGLPAVASSWRACAISTNAAYMLAAINSGILYMSTNTGNNWTMIGGTNSGSTFGLPSVSSSWSSVSVNSTGSYMLAGINSGSLYLSTNYGTYWVTISGVPNTFGLPTNASAWSGTAINSTGTIMTASISSGYIYTTINGGKTWSPYTVGLATNGKWYSVAMNSSGNYFIAIQYGEYVYNFSTGLIPTTTYTPPQLSNTTTTDGTTLKYIMKY